MKQLDKDERFRKDLLDWVKNACVLSPGEELLLEAFERHDGDVRAIASSLRCASNTVEKYINRFNIREKADTGQTG